ncbi:MAG TPA: hypothetical protein VF640_00760 [Acidimicrobiales bacterium]
MTEPVTIDLSGGRTLTVEDVGEGRVWLRLSRLGERDGCMGTVDLAELYAAIRVATDTLVTFRDNPPRTAIDTHMDARPFLAERYDR